MDFGVKNAGWLIKQAEHHWGITLPLTSLAKLVYRRLFTILLKTCAAEVP